MTISRSCTENPKRLNTVSPSVTCQVVRGAAGTPEIVVRNTNPVLKAMQTTPAGMRSTGEASGTPRRHIDIGRSERPCVSESAVNWRVERNDAGS